MYYDEFKKELDELWGEIALLKSENAVLKSNRKYYKKPNPKTKPVVQYGLNMNKINEFNSLHEASIKTGLHMPNIWSCCNGKLKTTGGFIFRYKNS